MPMGRKFTRKPLDWTVFRGLSGDQRSNWETLCRAIVRRNYGRFGVLRNRRLQPGVEFHIELDRDCDLGRSGDHFGWQCKWYPDAAAGLSDAQRRDVEDSISKTAKHVPGVTDWVLWTPVVLTKSDQAWFFAIKTSLKLRLWSNEDVDELLVGDALVLREAYFGELVLTSDLLARSRDLAIQPIRRRWDPALRVEVRAETALRRMLGQLDAWPELATAQTSLEQLKERLNGPLLSTSAIDRELHTRLVADVEAAIGQVGAVRRGMQGGSVEDVRSAAERGVVWSVPASEVRHASRKLRGLRDPLGIVVATVEARRRASTSAVLEVRATLGVGLSAVIGGAGRGKTFLGASLTSGEPNGVFIAARDLANRGDPDDLVARIPSLPLASWSELLEAIDAAGARAGRRIPIVLDGLNESENYSDWEAPLARVQAQLSEYPHVLVVATLRPSAADVLPIDCPSIELPGFRPEVGDAVARYFDYYKIEAGRAPLPWDHFDNPLFLRLFCEAANPDRAVTVGVESLPGSLAAAYEEFVRTAVRRVATSLARGEEEVVRAVDRVAAALWDRGVRALPFEDLQGLIGDQPGDWARSLARALEEEGILTRESSARQTQQSSILFDGLAGFIVADYVMRTHGHKLAAWLNAKKTQRQLWRQESRLRRFASRLPTGLQGRLAKLARLSLAAEHPLREDILAGLVGLAPRRQRFQLWPLLAGGPRRQALREAAEIEGFLIDNETVNALEGYISERQDVGILRRLTGVHGSSRHPLNARFLHRVLRSMRQSDRDLYWTEWVRRSAEDIEREVQLRLEQWSAGTLGGEDDLDAIWLAWVLTTTNRRLRDSVTAALVALGASAPSVLLGVVEELLNAPDPYVRERLLAAAYGSAMANAASPERLLDPLERLLAAVSREMLSDAAPYPTTHWLMREYLTGMAALADAHGHSGIIPSRATWKEAPLAKPITESDPRAAEVQQTMHMDFANYTLGRLLPDRANYDTRDPAYVEVASAVRGRIWDLGWRSASFGQIDRSLGGEGRFIGSSGRLDRYGKKYGWIAYFEVAGWLDSVGRLTFPYEPTGRLSDLGIDPSFPARPEAASTPLPRWSDAEPSDDLAWLRAGQVEVPPSFLRADSVNGFPGPWIAVEGFMQEDHELSARRVSAFIRGLAVAKDDIPSLVAAVQSRQYLGNRWLPEPPQDHYMFAGEFPWHPKLDRGLEPYLPSEWDDDVGRLEVLGHDYTFESYHSELNQAGSHTLPSVPLAKQLGLWRVPPAFDFATLDGQLGALVLAAPTGFKGNVLYLREDLLLNYLGDRDLLWINWGERGLYHDYSRGRPPEPVEEITQAYENLWRQSLTLSAVMRT